jgi:biopolymer transport protein ExbB
MDGSSNGNFILSLLTFMQEGGAFMWIILVVWLVGLAMAIERFLKLNFRYNIDGPSFMNELQRYVLSNDIQGAIRACSGTSAMLPKVLKSGLKRASQSSEQIQNALDATSLEVIPKIELRLSTIPFLANISTLVGLLGTIQGLIQSFGAIAAADPSQKAEILAKGISTAMNTTFLGLTSAISLMLIGAFVSAKSEKIINEIDEFSIKLLDLLGTKKIKDDVE